MPTFGWRLEDDVERFWEGRPNLPRIDTSEFLLACSRCEMKFSSREELRHHFHLAHPLESSTIYVDGKPLLRESIIRLPIAENEVDLLQCSHTEVQMDGGTWQYLSLPQFRAQFCLQTNSTWNVRLVHERFEDGSRTTQEYNVRFRIPGTAELNQVDEHFIRTLVHEEVTRFHLEQFVSGLPTNAPEREYGSALGDYALGIILKERRTASYASIEFAEFASKMRSAHETLCLFQRPVALAVSSAIRFNLNNFYNYGAAAESEMDFGLEFFRNITGVDTNGEIIDSVLPALQKLAIHKVCPVDRVTHRLLSACIRLTFDDKLFEDDLNDLKQLFSGSDPLSEQDRAKVHVICAEGYLRLARPADALQHLHSIQFDPSFKDWAQRHLEGISIYGN